MLCGKDGCMVRRLLTPEREEKILSALGGGSRSIAELAAALDVSEATVRRDLQNLEAAGLLRRVHGGAEAVTGSRRTEPLFDEKAAICAEAKEYIAKIALREIRDREAIFLDGGSTVLALARLLRERSKLTVVTNSLSAAFELMDSGHKLILLGGEVRAISRTIVGPLTEPVASQLIFDKAFMGTIGFSPEEGMSTTDPNEAFTKALVMRRARSSYLLCDSSKIDAASFVRDDPGEYLQYVITEKMPSSAVMKRLKQRNINIITK